MKFYYFIILILIYGCSSIRQKSILEKNYSKPRRIVILIHGVGGSYRHFGHLREALEHHLSALDPQLCNEVIHFDYQTGNNKLTTFDFAEHLSRFLKGYFSLSSPLKAKDTISFVMHSQGGIVGNLWLLKTLSGATGYPKKYLKHIDSMITLSTPFWGANIANIATKLYGYNYLPYGKRELEEMTFDSQTISYLRQGLIKYSDKIKKSKIRFFNIAGQMFKGSRDDSMVAIPSANQNLIYLDSGKPPLTKNYKKSVLADFLLVDAIHFNVFALFFDVESLASIAQAFKSCIEKVDCKHPSFKQILSFIRNTSVQLSSQKNSGRFFLDIELKTKGVRRNQVKFEFNRPKPHLVTLDGHHPPDNYLIVPKDLYRFHFEGNILDSDYRERQLTFAIKAPNCRRLSAVALLQPGRTTYIPLTLDCLP